MEKLGENWPARIILEIISADCQWTWKLSSGSGRGLTSPIRQLIKAKHTQAERRLVSWHNCDAHLINQFSLWFEKNATIIRNFVCDNVRDNKAMKWHDLCSRAPTSGISNDYLEMSCGVPRSMMDRKYTWWRVSRARALRKNCLRCLSMWRRPLVNRTHICIYIYVNVLFLIKYITSTVIV